MTSERFNGHQQDGRNTMLPATRDDLQDIMQAIGGQDAATILIAMLRKLSQGEVTASTANAAANLVSRLVDIGRLGVEIKRLQHSRRRPSMEERDHA